MCRGKKQCVELGTDISLWNKKSPLQPPKWFNNEIKLFEIAFELALQNKIRESIDILSKIRDLDLRSWYVEHGQLSGRFRNRELEIKIQKSKNILLDKLRSPDKYRKEVFERDNYTCQYCGGKVIQKEIFKKYENLVGKKYFRATGTNAERHGVVLAFRANADHVIPWPHGGKTNSKNLVTSCWSCNYGKSGYALKEIKLDNPRDNSFSNNDWNGLVF